MNPFRIALPSLPKLKFGSQGKAVRFLQFLLSEYIGQDDVHILKQYIGKDVVVIDGNFKAVTERLVKEFQAQNSLKADGIVDKKTWQTLLFVVFKDNEVINSPPSPIHPPKKNLINWIVVMLDDASRLELAIKLVLGLGVIIIASVGSTKLDKIYPHPKLQPNSKLIQQELKQPNSSLKITKYLPSQANAYYQSLSHCSSPVNKTNGGG